MAFELVGKLLLIDQMTAPLRKATGAVGSLGSTTTSAMGGAISALKKVAVAVGVTKVAADTLNKAMDFESAVAGFAAISPEAKAAKDELASFSKQASMGTKFSAIEAADGIGELIRAGRSVSDVMSGDLKAAMAMAAADDMSLADACTIVSDTMNTFSRDGLTAANVADILAGASAASSTDIASLKMGLTAVGSVASSVGLTFRDTTTALGLMSNAGIKGSDAGTSLKTMLMNLQPTTKKQINMFKRLGIMTADGANKFYDSKGQLKDLTEISGILSNSMKDLTDQQRAVAMETMFGSDAIRAANVLYANGVEGVNGFYDAMSQTTALQMAADKLDSASGAADILKGILTTLQIEIGEAFLPVIRDFCKWAADAATKIVAWFESAEGQEVLKTLTQTIYGVIDAVKSFCAWLGEQLSPLFQAIQTDIQNVIDTLAAWWDDQDGQAWFDALRSGAESVIEKVTEIYTYFSDNWTTIAPIVMGIAGAIWAFNAATTVLGIVTAVQAAGGLAAAATAAWGFAAALLANPATWIALAIGLLIAAVVALWLNWDKVSAWLQASWDAIKAKAEEIWNGIAETFTGVWETIMGGVTAAWETITGLITGAWNGVATFLSGIDITEIGSAIFNTLGAGIVAAWGFITGGLPGLWGQVTGFFEGISLQNIGTNIIDGLWQGLKSTWASVTKWFDDMVNSIPQWVRDALGIHSPSRVMMELGEYTMQGYAIGMEKQQGDIEASTVRLAETPLQAVSPIARELENDTPTAGVTGATTQGASRQYVFQFGDIVLNGISGDLEGAADEFMEIIAARLQGEGGLVPEGV